MRWSLAVVVLFFSFARSGAAQEPVTDLDESAEAAADDEVETLEGEPTPDESLSAEANEAARAERLEEARLLFLAAQRAYDDGRYPDALASFERSYLLAEDPQILYNIGVTLDRLRRDEEALEAFEMYLRLRPGTPDRRSIEGRIRILQDQIARRHAAEAAEAEAEREEARAEVVVTTGDDHHEVTDDEEYTVLDRWWFWTAIVAFVAGGAVAVGIALSRDPAPIPGSEGVVLEALSW